jgi:hypothetical protein
LPTLSLLGVPEPLATPAAFFSSTAAGGVLVMKLKLRSALCQIAEARIERLGSEF